MLLIYSPRSIPRQHLVKEPTASGATYAIADVGGAIHATPGREMTLGVTTMPYRAPEVFFGSDCSLGGQREPQGVVTRRNVASFVTCPLRRTLINRLHASREETDVCCF